jgi:hypothetical protein
MCIPESKLPLLGTDKCVSVCQVVRTAFKEVFYLSIRNQETTRPSNPLYESIAIDNPIKTIYSFFICRQKSLPRFIRHNSIEAKFC